MTRRRQNDDGLVAGCLLFGAALGLPISLLICIVKLAMLAITP